MKGGNNEEMTNTRPRRRPRAQRKTDGPSKQKAMDGKFISAGVGYLVESFSLNSVDRRVNRRGTSSQPTTCLLFVQASDSSGRKMSALDLQLVEQHFSVFVTLVNQVLKRVYSSEERLRSAGHALLDNHGQGYVVLKERPYLAYKDNPEIRSQCYERMYRNVLEQAARIILSDWVRRELMVSALRVLSSDDTALSRLMCNRHIPPNLVRWVRKECPVMKDNGKGFYYSISILRQLRKTLDQQILNSRAEVLGRRGQQRRRVQELLADAQESESAKGTVLKCVHTWSQVGFPFATPRMVSTVQDFSGSTENMPGQGYWYSPDSEREDEILLFLKLPEPLAGCKHLASPYKTQTASFRFLDWLPRTASDDVRGAEQAAARGNRLRERSLRMRAAKFSDMHEQLVNTVMLQHAAHRFSLLKANSRSESEQVRVLTEEVDRLGNTRRCAPPRMVMRGRSLEMQIPFLPPTS